MTKKRTNSMDKTDPDSSKSLVDWNSDSEDMAIYIRQKKLVNGKDKLGRTEKQLCVLLVICMVVIVCLIAYVLLMNVKVYTQNTSKLKQKECVTPECILRGAELIKNMNLSADPCDNFYNYACGNWLQHTTVPDDKPKWTSFAQVYKKNQDVIKKVLETPGEEYKGKNSSAIRKAKDLYNSCMNLTHLEKLGAKPMLALIKVLGSWTITPDGTAGTWSKHWNLVTALATTHGINLHPLFMLGVSADEKDSSKNILKFSQSGLSLMSRKEYLTQKPEVFRQAYIKYFTRIAVLLGAKEDSDLLKKITEVYDFEKKLAEIHVARINLTDPVKNYNKMTIGELSDAIKPIQFKSYIDGLFNTTILRDEEIIVQNVEYISKLATLISETTNKEVLANYMVWYMIQNFIKYMPNEYRKAALILAKEEKGITALTERWSLCIADTDSSMGFASGALYVEKKFSEKDKKKVKEILRYIRDAFLMNLPSVKWMDSQTKVKAMEKAKAVLDQIGYPDWINHTDKLDQHYQDLSIEPDKFFFNGVSSYSWSAKRNREKRGKPPQRLEWHMSPDTVNAYYTSDFNYIAFPAGILQSPFYDPNMPTVVNFGSTGMVMGHELTHGFDNHGRHFDKDGNMKSWWTKQSADEFEKKAQCMIDQYNAYTVQNHHVIGKTTLGENIADNGGVKTAYEAYLLWHKANTKEKAEITGLKSNDLQLFFLGFSKIWCSYYQPAYAVSALTTDVHSPALYRVNGVVSNLKQFSDAYKCPAGSKMNPAKKCEIW